MNGMERNEKEWKKIILEYSSIPLFGSLRLRLGVHKGGEWNGMEWNNNKWMEMNGMECI